MKRKTRRLLLATAMMLAMLMPLALGLSCADDNDGDGVDDPEVSEGEGLNSLMFAALQGVVEGFIGGAGTQLWGWMLGGGNRPA